MKTTIGCLTSFLFHVIFCFQPALAEESPEKVWSGVVNGNWDLTTANWLLDGAGVFFAEGDDVCFTSSAETKDVVLVGSRSAGTVVFDGDADYTLTSETDGQSVDAGVGLRSATRVEKRGAGTLTVNGMHGFSGDLLVYGGVYKVGTGTTDVRNARNSPLGDPRTCRTIGVYTNAMLEFAGSATLGGGTSTSDILADVEIRGGTLRFAKSSCTPFGNLLLHNAVLEYDGGTSNWPLISMMGDLLSFDSDDPGNPYELEAVGDNCGFFLSRARPVEIRVSDITGDDKADVSTSFIFKDLSSATIRGWRTDGDWLCKTNFIKTGAGRLALKSYDSTMMRDVVVSNGVLSVEAGKARIGADTAQSTLGNTYDATRTLFVEKDAELRINVSDAMGQFFHDPSLTIHVRGGKLSQKAEIANSFGSLILEDAVLEYEGNYKGWPTIGFSFVRFTGTKAVMLPVKEGEFFAFSKHQVSAGGVSSRMGEIRVDKITSNGLYTDDPDVTICPSICDVANTWKTYNPGKCLPSSFRKTGAGVLLLNNANSTFTGDVEISDGVVLMAKLGAKSGSTCYEEATMTTLGNLMSGKSIRVNSGAELYFRESDTWGQMGTDYNATLAVSNATLRFSAGTANGLPALDLYDPVLAYTSGIKSYGLLALRYRVSFDGTRPICLPSRGDYCMLSVGYSSDFEMEEGVTNVLHGKTEFHVKDITEDAQVDVDIGMTVQSMPWWNRETSKHYNDRFSCGVLKTGPGTLRFSGTVQYPEDTRINEGVVQFDGQVAGTQKTTMRVQDGAYLSGSGSVRKIVIETGGGFASVVDQARPLQCTEIALPPDGVVNVNIVQTNDLETVSRVRVPIIACGSSLSTARFTVLHNGKTPDSKCIARAFVRDGVLYGEVRRLKGCMLIFR